MCQLQFVDTSAGAEGDLSYEEFAAEIQVQVDSSCFKLIQVDSMSLRVWEFAHGPGVPGGCF